MSTKKIIFILISVFALNLFAQVDKKAKEILDNYIKAVGGKGNVELIKDRKMVMSANMQGMTIKLYMYQKEPNMFKNVVSFGGMEQVTVYDGKKGFMKINDKVIELTGTQLDQYKYQSDMSLALNIDTMKDVHVSYVGKEDVDGEATNKLAYITNDSTKWTENYSVKTGLKVKQASTVVSEQGSFDQVTYFSDYKSIGNVLFPHKISQQVAGQNIVMIIEKVELNTGIKDEMFKLEE